MAKQTYPIRSPLRHDGKVRREGFVHLVEEEAESLQARGVVGEAVQLPRDYPGRDELLAAGLTSEGQVQDAGREAVGAIDGIGKKTLKAIFKSTKKDS